MKQLKTINLTTKILVALVVGIFAHLDSLVYGSVFYGLTVINIRLYVALGSSVIGMMVYNVEKG